MKTKKIFILPTILEGKGKIVELLGVMGTNEFISPELFIIFKYFIINICKVLLFIFFCSNQCTLTNTCHLANLPVRMILQ